MQKTYGGSGFDRANCIQKTNDGHYIIAGNTVSSDGDVIITHGGSDAWVVKIDDLGTILQQTTIGTNGSSEGSCLLHNPNYDFNDEILPLGASYWTKLVENELSD